MTEFPGQKLEEAGAEVVSDAGKSIVRGLGRVFGASLAEWIVKKEAKAEAAKLAIETESKINTAKAVALSRRENELKEVDHQHLVRQRAERLYQELAREEQNFQAITHRAIEIADENPQSGPAQELDEDWLFKFARYAEQASDKAVQELWAQVLSSAATKGDRPLSPAALQIMTLLDKKIAADFEKISNVIYALGSYPTQDNLLPEIQDIDISELMELGLVDKHINRDGVSIDDFDFYPALAVFVYFTNRGREIAKAIFCNKKPSLTADLKQAYLRGTIDLGLKKSPSEVALSPHNEEGKGSLENSIIIRNKKPFSSDLKEIVIHDNYSETLKDLIKWAKEKYMVGSGKHKKIGED